ncbi:hypothetical protein J4419_05120 [Candidatus Woesearchaeota archaeon]|nr:hypothetical protein [Candidatus Woesearchaeota archaeon]
MAFSELIALICLVVVIVFPNLWAKLVSGVILVFQLYLVFIVEGAVIDAGVDVGVGLLQQYNLIDIPESVCPGSFNRTEYCVEFGLANGNLDGQVFVTGQVNEVIDVQFETAKKSFSCPLTTGKACQFAEINSLDDLKISLTDKKGTAVLTSTDLAKEVKRITRALRAARTAKWLNKVF